MANAPEKLDESPKLSDLLLQVEMEIVDQHMSQLWSKAVQSAANRSLDSTEEDAGEEDHTESLEGSYLDDAISLEDLDEQLRIRGAQGLQQSLRSSQGRRSRANSESEYARTDPRRRTLDNMFRLLDPPQTSGDINLVCPTIAYALRFETRPHLREKSPMEAQTICANLLDPWVGLIHRLYSKIAFNDHFQALSYLAMLYEFQKTLNKPLGAKLISDLLSLLTPATVIAHRESPLSFSFAMAVLDLVCTWAYYTHLQSRATKQPPPDEHILEAICASLMAQLDGCLTFNAPKNLGVPNTTFIWLCTRAIGSVLVSTRFAPPSHATASRLLNVLSTAFQRNEQILNPPSIAELEKSMPKEDILGDKLDLKPPKLIDVTDDHVLCCMWSLTALEILNCIYSYTTFKNITKTQAETLKTITEELTRLCPKVLACAFPRSFRPPYRKLKASALNTIDRLCKTDGSTVLTTLLDAGLRITFNCVWLIRTLFPNYFRFRGTVSQLNALLVRIEMKERKPRFEQLFPDAAEWDLLRAAHDQSSFEAALSRAIATDTPRRAVISTLRMLIPPRVWTSQAALFVLGKIFAHPQFHTFSSSLPEISVSRGSRGPRSAVKAREIDDDEDEDSTSVPSASAPPRPTSTSPSPASRTLPSHTSQKDVLRPKARLRSERDTNPNSLAPPQPSLNSEPPPPKALWKTKGSAKSASPLLRPSSAPEPDPNRKPRWEDPCKSLTLWDLTIPQPRFLITTWEEAVHAFCRTGLRPEIVFAIVDELKGVDACEIVNNQHVVDGVEHFLMPQISVKYNIRSMDPDRRQDFWYHKLANHLRPSFINTWILTPSMMTFNPQDVIKESWRSTAAHLVYEQATIFAQISSADVARVRVCPPGAHRGAMFDVFYLDIVNSKDTKSIEKAEAIIKSKLRSKSWSCLFLPSDDNFHLLASSQDSGKLLNLDYGPAHYCYLDLPTAIYVAKTLYPTCPTVTIIPVNSHSTLVTQRKSCLYLQAPSANPVELPRLPYDSWSRAVLCIRNDFRDAFASKVLEADAVLGPIACSWWNPKSRRAMRHYGLLPAIREDLQRWDRDNSYYFGTSAAGKESAESSGGLYDEGTKVEESEETDPRDSFAHDEEVLRKSEAKSNKEGESGLRGALQGKTRNESSASKSHMIPPGVEDTLPRLRSCPLKWESDPAVELVTLTDLLNHPHPSDYTPYVAIRHKFLLDLMQEARRLKVSGDKPPGVIVMRLKPSGGTFPLTTTSSTSSTSPKDTSSDRKSRCAIS